MRLKNIARTVIDKAVKPWGMELAYTHLLYRPGLRRDWIKGQPVRTVFDIGANVGQFATEIRDLLPGAFIYSFEPLTDAYASLVSTMRGDPNFKAFNLAMGERDSQTVIHRSSSSDSSSLRPMLEKHKEAWPHTAGSSTEEIEVRRLDSLDIPIKPELLIKMDVQGYEDKVIAGGRNTISQAAYVITEVSFQMLYQGQPLFDDIYQLLKGMGFEYGGVWGQLPDPRNGRPLQADAIFINPKNAL